MPHTNYRAHIDIIIGGQSLFDEVNQYPEHLLFGEALGEEMAGDVVEALAVQDVRVADGVGEEHVAEAVGEVCGGWEGSWDVFADDCEEGLGVLWDGCQEQFVGLGMGHLCEVGLREQ
jgi:hypothetical protein